MEPVAPILGLPDVAGIALALLLASLLWARGPHARRANAWLAAAVVALALIVIGRLDGRPLGLMTGWVAFVFGPCLWLFACRVTGEAGPRGQRLAVHFIPAVAMLLVLLPKRSALEVHPASGPDALYVLTAMHMLAYWLLASLRLGRAGHLKLRARLWACMAVWAVWIAIGAWP